MDFSEENFRRFLVSIADVHSAVIEYLGSNLGTGPGLTPVPLAGPKEQ